MTIDFYLTVKYVASACTAAYGIYATLNDFHEQKDGQRILTKKGYIGIAFLIVSTFFSFSSDVTKDLKEKKSAAEEQKHREEITKNMNDELQKTGAISTTLQESLTAQNKAFRTITTNLQSEVTQTQTVKNGLDRSLGEQTKLLADQQQLAVSAKALQLQVIRPYYPLNPVAISYEVDFSMDDKRLASYVTRLRSDLVRIWNTKKVMPDVTLTKPEDFPLAFNLKNIDPSLLPGAGEADAARAIFGWGVVFYFVDPAHPDKHKVEFICISPDYAEVVRTLSKGPPVFESSLSADFTTHLFRLEVRSQNPLVNGTDQTAFSVLDLVGLDMKWKPYPENSSLVVFGIRFPKDYDDADQRAHMLVPAGATSIRITPAMVGLEKIYSDLDGSSRRK